MNPNRPLLIENSSGVEASGTEDVYRVGGATEMVNVRCERWGPWGNTSPADYVPAILGARSRLRPGEPLCVKLTWFGMRTLDAVNGSETVLRPAEGQIIDAYRTGLANGSRVDEQGDSDLSLAASLGSKLKELGVRLDVIHINDESGNGPWAYSQLLPTDTPAARSLKVTANTRNTAILHAVLMDDQSRAALAPSLRSIPKDPAAIDEAFRQFGTMKEQFEARQRDWTLRWNTIRLRTLRMTLNRAGLLGDSTRVYVSFTGGWRQYVCDVNGHEQAPVPMPAQFFGNWQCYGWGWQPRLIAASMAATPGTRLTFQSLDDPSVVREYLRVAAPAGAILYCPDGIAGAARHSDVIREYTQPPAAAA
jgi:hypothetical protein